MRIALRVCLTVFAACMLSSLLANSASAQGCCKAGICKIPQIPSSSANSSAAAAFADSMLNQNAMRDQTAARPASSAARMPAAKGDVMEISLVNPVNSQAKVEYVLDGKTYALEPGMSLTLRAAQPRKIEFSRDQAGAKATYRVSKGIYEFAMTDKGWELYRTQK